MELRTLEERQAADRAEQERVRVIERTASHALPVVITGIRIPFWRLVWWLVGITAGVNLIHAAFNELARLIASVVGG